MPTWGWFRPRLSGGTRGWWPTRNRSPPRAHRQSSPRHRLRAATEEGVSLARPRHLRVFHLRGVERPSRPSQSADASRCACSPVVPTSVNRPHPMRKVLDRSLPPPRSRPPLHRAHERAHRRRSQRSRRQRSRDEVTSPVRLRRPIPRAGASGHESSPTVHAPRGRSCSTIRMRHRHWAEHSPSLLPFHPPLRPNAPPPSTR